MSYAYKEGMDTLGRALKASQIGVWCEIEKAYLLELQKKAGFLKEIILLLSDYVNWDAVPKETLQRLNDIGTE